MAQKQKYRTTKRPLMQDWLFRLGSIYMMMCVAQFFLGAISGGFWLNAGCEVFIGRITNLLSLKRTLGHVRGLYYAIFYF